MLELRKAKLSELKELKQISQEAVENMHANGIDLWNAYYPAEVLEEYIEKEELYIATFKEEIIGLFALSKEEEGIESFAWQYGNEMYLHIFLIQVKHLKKGYAKEILKLIIQLLQKQGYLSLRLIVFDKNIPA